MMKKFEESNRSEDQPTESEENNDEGSDGPTLILKVPFRGQKGEALLKKLNNNLKRSLPETKYRIVHTGTKLSKYFSLKDKTKKEHMSNFIYRHKCKNKKCKDDYCGETSRRRTKRTGEHSGKDKKSHIFLHSSSTKHPRAKDDDFEVLATNYPDRRKRKLAEAMFIRDLKPTLNKQKDSFRLALFV